VPRARVREWLTALQWQIVGTGDFNGDGKADILWQKSSTGQRVIWLMNRTTFQSAVSLGTVPTSWSIAGSGDFNGERSPRKKTSLRFRTVDKSNYAEGRASFRSAEMRILDSSGKVERTIPFDETDRKL
jgi:hypothetical protein